MNALEYAEQFGEYRRVAATHGGEWAGPCLHCGGNDRCHIQPAHPDRHGSWMCRNCTEGGWRNAPALVLAHHNTPYSPKAYAEACKLLELAPQSLQTPLGMTARPPADSDAPGAAWQARAKDVVRDAQAALWNDEDAGASRARAYLAGRGLTRQSIIEAQLGYVPTPRFEDATRWGLPESHASVCVPRGITIPWLIGSDMWRINVRLPVRRGSGEQPYQQPAGGGNALYRADTIQAGDVVVLVEGEFDALIVAQEARDSVRAVATGSTTHGRRTRWIGRLSLAQLVLVAFDAEPTKGDVAAQWWIDNLASGLARRLRPRGGKDPNEMFLGGRSIQRWIDEAMLATAAPSANPYRLRCHIARIEQALLTDLLGWPGALPGPVPIAWRAEANPDHAAFFDTLRTKRWGQRAKSLARLHTMEGQS